MTTKNELAKLREHIGVSQTTMAKFMGVPFRTYQDLEAGVTKLREVHMNAARYASILLRGSDDAVLSASPLTEEVHTVIRKALEH